MNVKHKAFILVNLAQKLQEFSCILWQFLSFGNMKGSFFVPLSCKLV